MFQKITITLKSQKWSLAMLVLAIGMFYFSTRTALGEILPIQEKPPQGNAPVDFEKRTAVAQAVVDNKNAVAAAPAINLGVAKVVIPAQIVDFNKDGWVNREDLKIVGDNFGQQGDGIIGDVNGDNEVNIFDLVSVARYYGTDITAALITELSKTELDFLDENYNRVKEALIEIGEPAATRLLQNVVERNSVPFWMVDILINMGDMGDISIGPMIGTLDSIIEKENTNPEVITDLIALLSFTNVIKGERAIPVLMKALELENLEVQATTAWVLGKIGPKSAVAIDKLIEMLSSQDTMVRRSSAWALGEIGDNSPKVREALTRALNDPSSSAHETQEDVREALAKLDHAE